DYAIGKDHQLPIIHAIGKDGRLTEVADSLSGTKVADARQLAADKLAELGAINKTEDYTHQVPICERCKTVVEPLVSEEWFVKMKSLAAKAIQAIADDKINFLPPNYSQILTKW